MRTSDLIYLEAIIEKRTTLISSKKSPENQQELHKLDQELKFHASNLGKFILSEFINPTGDAESQNSRNLLVTAVLAVIQHMVKQRKYSIHQIIRLLQSYLHTPYLKTLSQSEDDRALDECRALVDSTRLILEQHKFKRTSASRYTLKLDPLKDRDTFESPQAQLFEIDLPGMSSGQWAIFNQVISLHEAIKEHSQKKRHNLLVLIDEGDAFLHLAWQRRYIWQMNRFLSDCKKKFRIPNLQLIIASHSPMLASDVPGEYVCQLNVCHEADGSSPASNDDVYLTQDQSGMAPAFAAPLHAILNRSFSSVSIGEFAVRRINSTITALNEGTFGKREQYLISIIDDPIIQRELQRLVPQGKGGSE